MKVARVFLAFVFGLTPPLCAHPFHATIAEARFDPATGELQVALKVFALDLERAIELHAKTSFDLEAPAARGARVRAYLESAFRIVDEAGRPSALEWVGMELDLKQAWLYFAFDLSSTAVASSPMTAPAPVAESIRRPPLWTIENRVLFELRDHQMNTVIIGAGRYRRTLRFTREAWRRPLPAPPRPAGAYAPVLPATCLHALHPFDLATRAVWSALRQTSSPRRSEGGDSKP